MIRRIFAATLTVAMSVMLVACGSQEEPVNQAESVEKQAVKIGMSGGYYPFTFVENGELQGFEVDVWNELGKRMDRPVEFVTAPFSGLFGMLESQRINTIANQITVTEARLQKYNFADAYVYDGAQITVNANTNDINTLEDLKGKIVAVNLGSNFEELISAYDTNGEIEVRTYDTGIGHEVALGRADAFIMDRVSTAELVKKSGLPLKLAGEPFEVIQNAMPFLKTDDAEQLRLQVNKALTEMRADGTLKAISEQWFGADITNKG